MKSSLFVSVFAFLGLISQPLLVAAPVFGTSTPVTADSNVVNIGTAVLAYDFANAFKLVNGVQFSGTTATQNGVTFAYAGLTTAASNGVNAAGVMPNLSADLTAVLGSNRYNPSATPAASFTLSGLTSGHQYELQIFDGTVIPSGHITVTDGASSGSLDFGPTTSGTGADFITEIFTAGPSHVETIGLGYNAGYVILNAVNLRDITSVPEPGTWAMIIGGAGLLCGAMRFFATRRTA